MCDRRMLLKLKEIFIGRNVSLDGNEYRGYENASLYVLEHDKGLD